MCPVLPLLLYASSLLLSRPPAKCFFPLHSVLYYCQITIPKVKIRSHQLGQKYFMVCGTWSFPWHDPKSLLVLCSATPSLHRKQGEQYIEVILLVVLLLLLVVKQQYSSSQGHRTRCAEHCSRCLLFFIYILSPLVLIKLITTQGVAPFILVNASLAIAGHALCFPSSVPFLLLLHLTRLFSLSTSPGLNSTHTLGFIIGALSSLPCSMVVSC